MLYKLFSYAFSASLVMGQTTWTPQKVDGYPDAISAVLPNKNTLPTGAQQNAVNGFLTLHVLEDAENKQNTRIQIKGEIKGLKPNQKHGFHIHEFGNIYKSGENDNTLDLPPTVDCSQTGGHYNPLGKKHGGLTGEERHVGDLENIEAKADGTAIVDITTTVKLDGPNSVLGRAFVIHERKDDKTSKVTATGNSGGRLACGVISIYGVVKPVLKPAKIGCYKFATDGFVSGGVESTMDECATTCAAETYHESGINKNYQYFGIDPIKRCACFESMTAATKNGRCEPGNQYDLYFNPMILAKTKNGLIKEKSNRCIQRGDENNVILNNCDSANQRWIFTDDGRIMNYGNSIATCLTLGKNYEADGAVIVKVQPCHDPTTPAKEQWELTMDNQIKNKLDKKCIANYPPWSIPKGYKEEQVIVFDCTSTLINNKFDHSGIKM